MTSVYHKPIVPSCKPPDRLITGLVACGAEKEIFKGDGSRVVRISGVDSSAWRLYQQWACTLKEANPLVCVSHSPTVPIIRASLCPQTKLGGAIQMEAASLLNHVASLSSEAFSVGLLAFLASIAPLSLPGALVNVRHAHVAVTVLLRVISNPGHRFPVIHALPSGQYICHALYTWREMMITVPIFRK